MTKLFKYLKSSIRPILLILCALVLQAICDLSLPSYTSDIVNVGIQQGGITESTPRAIRKSEMERIFLFTDEADREKILDEYDLIEQEACSEQEWKDYIADYPELRNEPLYLQKDLSEEKQQDLSGIMAKPMMVTYLFEQEENKDASAEETKEDGDSTSMQLAELKANMAEAMGAADPSQIKLFDVFAAMPEEQLMAMREEIYQKFDEMPETMINQAVIGYMKGEYDAIGMNVDKVQTNYLLSAGAKMLLVALISMLASIFVGFLAARVAASTSRNLRSQIFAKVIGFSNSGFDKFSTASLITRSTNDIQQVQTLIVMLLRMLLYAPILGIGGVIKIMDTNTSMAWIIGVAVAIIMILVVILFAVVMPRFKLLQKLVDKLNLVNREILTGLSVIRAFSKEKHEEKRFDAANKDLMNTHLFVNRIMTCMMPLLMLIMNGISLLIVWNGAHSINDGVMQVGDMMAFMQYTMQIIMSFLMICMVSIMLPRASVSAVRIDEVLSFKTAIHDPEQPKQLIQNEKGVVSFHQISFRYPGAEEDVLHDISFTAKPGETTAIIGSTGSGKSTLINLIPRFYDATEGSITVGGTDVREITQKELRKRLGYVPQKGVLFSGTIASNITYGNNDATEAEMKKAAEIAQAVDFIEEKSEGYDSHIAQGGANVSGGQKQRLSIARAIAKHPDIYIFDDSFSALDYKTDVTLRKALKDETADSTVLIVAQRISTILHAEQIIVLDGGKVAGIGTHEELLRNCDEYYQIASSQLSETELAAVMNRDAVGKEDM